MEDVTTDEWTARAAAIAGDRDSGASEILARLLPLVEEAREAAPVAVPAMAAAVRMQQPAMAGLAYLMAAAADDVRCRGRLAEAAAVIRRAPAALTRVATGAVLAEAAGPPWRLATWSSSSAVARLVEALVRQGAVDILCAEGRPRLEGRRLAVRLAAAGASVTVMTDAAVTSRVDDRLVVVGADAVTAEGWINKVGTAAVAAAARRAGGPVLVLASREKFARTPGFAAAALATGAAPDEVWSPAVAGIRVSNPTFELIALDLATLVVTDRDALPPVAIQASLS
jgi:translation initiation factor 2B subunit (eIF-2B alpha/beta/delta family)